MWHSYSAVLNKSASEKASGWRQYVARKINATERFLE
jgi:hypothetical protein